MKIGKISIILFLQLIFSLPVISRDSSVLSDSALRIQIMENADELLNGTWFMEVTGYQKRGSIEIDTIIINRKRMTIRVVADSRLAWFPARLPVIDSLERGMLAGFGEGSEQFSLEIYSAKRNIREYVPNYYRRDIKQFDRSRSVAKFRRKSPPLVRNLSRPYLSDAALYNKNIALWHSHGWYYESSLNRWEWQRARLFQTVEDLYPMAYTLQMLVPMLENAGAGVFLPRERDWQVHEVIVDNDGSTGNSLCVSADPGDLYTGGTGFAVGNPPYVDENPFTLGTWQKMPVAREASGSVQWIPEIPEEGEYGVYISYHSLDESPDDACYRVHHAGGVTEFLVNQRMGGGTWVYLGRFSFNSGLNPESGKVVLTNESGSRKAVITSDAVRFGGGVGNISRHGLTGLRPRYQEAARYYLQYAGFPDTLVWKLNGSEHDYKDDYQSRGEWVSYLMGAPSGPTEDKNAKGLGIPVDLSFAFHTDAGITTNDTVIGTLGIFSTNYRRGPFPSGLSRMASRDLADLIQTQIVDDIRALYNPAWIRRGLWDQAYSEAFRPNVPAMLLELLSHQNLIDVRFGQEPMFRFHTSRAVYKGMLRFLSTLYGTEYVVQPLPVTHLNSGILPGGGIALSWRAVPDPLEPTAEPDHYRIYTSINGGGFDHGVDVEGNTFTLEEAGPDTIYSFKVTALNRGGESFSSEVVSVCQHSDSKGTVLMISAFDRTGGAAWFEDTAYAGFMPMIDQGVPWHEDIHTVGAQYDYLKSSPWLDDDSPGHGASYADQEGVIIPGNSFDFPVAHGSSIGRAGYSFVTVSDESVLDDSVELDHYIAVDFIAGEEKSTLPPGNDSVYHYQVLTDSMMLILESYLEEGGSLFISGAHIASDVHLRGQDSVAGDLLKYRWRTSNASRTGEFYFMDPAFAGYKDTYSFNTGTDTELYTVEGADALEPADSTAMTLIRYRENNASAAVAYRGEYGVVAMGFPFETITDQGTRDLIMKKILHYLTEQKENE
ncbi:MAG: hypothetical protein GY790_12770 [Bacteroidetes bacterium]|nr:hypothetical protein [Bacteroidota bacterium]